MHSAILAAKASPSPVGPFAFEGQGHPLDKFLKANKKPPVDLGSLARSHSERAIQTIAGLMDNGAEEATRLRAADILLDRGWGRPRQDNTHEMKGEVRVVLRKMLTDEELEEK